MNNHLLRTLAATLSLVAAFVAGGSALAADAPAAGARTIIVGVNPIFPPFEMEEKGEVVGFDIDLVRAAAAAADLQVTFRTMPFSGIIPSLQAGSIDAAASGITITRERLQSVLFTDAYYRSGLSVLVKKGSPITGFDDVAGHVVATQKATSSVEYLREHGVADAQVKQFQNINGAYQALITGGADAVLFDNPVNVMFAKDRNQVAIVGDLLTGEYYGIAVSKKKPELAEQLNAGLAAIKENGEYGRLFAEYFGDDTSGAVTQDRAPDAVAIGN